MANSQFRSKKKVSGGKYIAMRKKRLCDLAGLPAQTVIGTKRIKAKRVKGGNVKRQILSQEEVLVNDGTKVIKVKIQSVTENPANVNYTRRNIITKGCIIKTEKGEVKITSRPGQSGTLFGIFI